MREIVLREWMGTLCPMEGDNELRNVNANCTDRYLLALRSWFIKDDVDVNQYTM